jgi:hypothetical protein
MKFNRYDLSAVGLRMKFNRRAYPEIVTRDEPSWPELLKRFYERWDPQGIEEGPAYTLSPTTSSP